MLSFIESLQAVYGLIHGLILFIGNPANIPEKTTVIATATAEIALLPIPAWAKAIFGNKTLLNLMVGFLIALLYPGGQPGAIAKALIAFSGNPIVQLADGVIDALTPAPTPTGIQATPAAQNEGVPVVTPAGVIVTTPEASNVVGL